MPRPATGTIIERRNAAGGINRTLRFNVNGKKRAVALGEVSRAEAERKLRLELDRVAEGGWTPQKAPQAAARADLPTFHEFAEEWWLLHEGRLSAKTRTDYRWRLEKHLLGHFGEMRLDEITFDTVERYIAAKLAEGERIREAAERGEPLRVNFTDSMGRRRSTARKPLSPRAINMTVTLLAAIMESALERELITRNPAKGKGRRVRERAAARSYLENAAQITALLDTAGEIDAEATRERTHLHRRACVATMIFAGLRIGEVCSLRWRDVDLAAGWLTVGESKTDAGLRKVKIRGALRDELLAVRSRQDADPDGYVFPTRTERRQYECKVRTATLGAAVKRANENLAARDLPPLPAKLTPHSLRRTFATILYALGESSPVVMAEMGHTDAALGLRVYAQALRLSDGERAQLAELVEGGFGHSMDTKAARVPVAQLVIAGE